jgi:hypothetical protein
LKEFLTLLIAQACIVNFVQKAKKYDFICYEEDHAPDTFRFYNPETDKVFLSRDAKKWLEWYKRIAGVEDMDLFEQLEALKMSSIISEIDVSDQPLDEDDPTFFPICVDDELPHHAIPPSLLRKTLRIWMNTDLLWAG